MKYLILFILSINTALACKLSIPESYIPTFLNPPVSGHYEKCEDKPNEKCHCVEAIDPWTSELTDNMVLDFIRKEQEASCESEEDCQLKLEALVCESGSPIKNLESMSVYCAIEFMKKDGVKLVVSPAKKAAKEAAEKAEKEAQKAKEEKCKSFQFKGATIAALRAEMNEWKECK